MSRGSSQEMRQLLIVAAVCFGAESSPSHVRAKHIFYLHRIPARCSPWNVKEPKTTSIKHVTVKYIQTFNGKRRANLHTIKLHSLFLKRKSKAAQYACSCLWEQGVCPQDYASDVELPGSSCKFSVKLSGMCCCTQSQSSAICPGLS